MPAPIVEPDASLTFVLEEATYTQARLTANPLTADLAADFEAFAGQWAKVNEQEVQHRVAVVKADALAAAADDALDELVDEIAQAVLLEVKDDRKAPEYLLYFGAKSPAELKQPVLGGQLATMRGWVPSLLGSSNATIKGLGGTLQSAVAAANAAFAGQSAAEQKSREFRTLGERWWLIDSLNTLCKAVYEKLSAMPQAHPDNHLPATFADDFFRHESSRALSKATVADLVEQIATVEAQLAELKAQLAKVTAGNGAALEARKK